VNCLSQAAYQTFTITNTGPSPIHITPTFGLGPFTPYTLADDSNLDDGGAPTIVPGQQYPITIAPGSSSPNNVLRIRVIPKPILRPANTAADAFADTLTISTDANGDAAHVVALHQTAQGAILTYAPSAIASTDTTADHVTFQNFTLSNTGNYAVSYTINAFTTKTGSPGNSPNFVINLPAPNSLQQLFGGAAQNGVLSTRSTIDKSQALGYIEVLPADGSLLCSDPPPHMPISSN
jgi:hypothetical protein